MTTKEKISSTASKLFHEKGFQATSVREIAAAVGIEAASLYNHISSKTDLLENICFETARKFESHLKEVLLKRIGTVDKLNQLLQFHIDLAIHDPRVLTVFSQEWRYLPDSAKTRFQLQRKKYEKQIIQLISEGQKTGEISSEPDAEIMTKMLLSSIQWVYFSKPQAARENEVRIRQNVELFIKNTVEKLTRVSVTS
jgi:AcrR family transcriptional regulator